MSLGAVPQVVRVPEQPLDHLVRLTALLDRAEPRVRRRFLQLVDAADALDDLETVAAALERGDLAAALRSAEEIGPGLSTSLESAYTAAGYTAAEVLRSRVDTLLDFNALNERAVASMQANRARLIRELTAEQRVAAQEFLGDALARGLAPVEQARALKRSIGLTQRQARAVTNFRRLLEQGSAEALTRELRDRRFDSTVAAAIRGDRALTTEQIDRMVDRYRERYVQYRARTIARTETIRAIHEGDAELWNQALEAGVMSPDEIERVWYTARDERVRGSHRFMDGQRRGPDEPFTSGRGYELRFPGDPQAPASETVNCRCVIGRDLPNRRNRT